MNSEEKLLRDGLTALNLSTDDGKVAKLLAFIALIEKWNKVYNLTSIRKRDEMVNLHLLDSVAILPHLEGKRMIDVGTGAGLPSIPLAIYRPDIEFQLIDSNAKNSFCATSHFGIEIAERENYAQSRRRFSAGTIIRHGFDASFCEFA